MSDILFTTDEDVFSYRVAGICMQNGKVLLQKPTNDDGFAFPGGHVAFGETNEETLLREFREEIGADIVVGDLKWVGEIFFQWGDKPCHQICLYYAITIENGNIPAEGMFLAQEQLEGRDLLWNSTGCRLIRCRTLPCIRLRQRSFLIESTGACSILYIRNRPAHSKKYPFSVEYSPKVIHIKSVQRHVGPAHFLH